MSKSPSLRRIQADIRELKFNPSSRYYAAPLDDNMFEWHFTIRGPSETEFEGGVYHGRILLPPEYPFKPPHIMFLNQSGRFEINTKICLSFTAHHAELWQPAWGIRLILEALISFFPTPADGAIGALNWSKKERQRLAKESRQGYCCVRCGDVSKLLLPQEDGKKVNGNGKDDDKQQSSMFSNEIAKLHMFQKIHHSEKMDGGEGIDGNSQQQQQGVCEVIGNNREEEVVLMDENTVSNVSNDNTSESRRPEEELIQRDNDVDECTEQDRIGNDEPMQLPGQPVAFVAEDDRQQRQESSMLDLFVPAWLTDPMLDAILVVGFGIVIILVRKVQELTSELHALSRREL